MKESAQFDPKLKDTVMVPLPDQDQRRLVGTMILDQVRERILRAIRGKEVPLFWNGKSRLIVYSKDGKKKVFRLPLLEQIFDFTAMKLSGFVNPDGTKQTICEVFVPQIDHKNPEEQKVFKIPVRISLTYDPTQDGGDID